MRPPWLHSSSADVSDTASRKDLLRLNFNYASCPATIQRKCFSSLERLRIAQSQIPDPPPPPSSRKRSLQAEARTISSIDAAWFRNLPTKVQQQHFTAEERFFLSREPIQPDAVDARLYGLLSPPQSPVHDSLDCRAAPSDFQCTKEEVDMDDAMFRGFKTESELDLAATLDDYHAFYAPTPSKRRQTHRPSFRKVMSLSSIPFQASPESPPPMPFKSQPYTSTTPLNQPSSTPSGAPVLPPLGHTIRPSAPASPAEQTMQYRDPSARLKLRVYASPQKFDEAIEFGFPSVNSRSRHFSPTSPTSNPNPSIYDALSISSCYSEDESFNSLPGPSTPPDANINNTTYLLSPSVGSIIGLDEFSSHATSRSQSLAYSASPVKSSPSISVPAPSNWSRPIIRHNSDDAAAHGLAGNREMTLRMTLTRPDLREDALGEAKHGQVPVQDTKSDPLALDGLDVIERAGGDIWDSLPPVQERGLRKMWRKVSGKNI